MVRSALVYVDRVRSRHCTVANIDLVGPVIGCWVSSDKLKDLGRVCTIVNDEVLRLSEAQEGVVLVEQGRLSIATGTAINEERTSVRLTSDSTAAEVKLM